MATPKFIDGTDGVIDDAIMGFLAVHPHCQLIEGTHVVVSKQIDPTKVQIICGGGSGHEPAHIGFVDHGWISAAVAGGIFASPPTAHVSAAIDYLYDKQGPNGPGILVVVKNYLGDLLNFGFAVEAAVQRGVRVSMVLAADDACFGVQDTSRRRGIAGTVVLYKILGAAALRGASLIELTELATRVSGGMRSLGASLSSCSLPGCKPSSVVPAGHVEVGLGIHGEKGLHQVPYEGARQLVLHLLSVLLENPASRGWKGAKVALLVNNLGSATDIELGVIAQHALQGLRGEGVDVIAMSVGRYMTALEMHGFSITVLQFENDADAQLLFDAQQAPLMPFAAPPPAPSAGCCVPRPRPRQDVAINSLTAEAADAARRSLVFRAAEHIFSKLQGTENFFNELDAAVGDGDLGSGVRRAATKALSLISCLPWATACDSAFATLAQEIAEAWGGTSGPLYGAFLLGVAAAVGEAIKTEKTSAVDVIRAALKRGSAEVQRIGRAKKGERTMVDVLEAINESSAVAAAAGLKELAEACLDAAREGADAVAQMPAKHGRSRYLQGKEIGQKDPGATLVAFWIEAAAESIKHSKDIK